MHRTGLRHAQGMWLADLHVHSNFSDGKLSISELVDLYGQLKFGCISVTDHVCEERTWLGKAAAYMGRTLTRATFPRYQEVLHQEARRAWTKYGMLLLPGIEITKNSFSNHRSAHILGVGVDEWISADHGIEATTSMIRRQGALAIAAHPVSTREFEPQTFHLWSRRFELHEAFDAWEVASGPHLFHEVLHSGLPMIASSDLHHPKQIRSWKTAFTCERSKDAIVESIRLQQVEFHFYENEKNNVPREVCKTFSPHRVSRNLVFQGPN